MATGVATMGNRKIARAKVRPKRLIEQQGNADAEDELATECRNCIGNCASDSGEKEWVADDVDIVGQGRSPKGLILQSRITIGVPETYPRHRSRPAIRCRLRLIEIHNSPPRVRPDLNSDFQ